MSHPTVGDATMTSVTEHNPAQEPEKDLKQQL